MTITEERRCYRAGHCERREPLRHPDGAWTGDYLGALLEESTGLCPRCTSRVDEALLHLPGDHAELHTQLAPTAARLGTGAGPVSRTRPGSVLPLRENPFALMELIEHELCGWATSVADLTNTTWFRRTPRPPRVRPPWATRRDTRPGVRVQRAARYLQPRLPALLGLGPVEHRARSLAVRRDTGHHTVTVWADDYWTIRTGLDGAVVLLRLHRIAWAMGQNHQTPRDEPVRCLGCGAMKVRRKPGQDYASCAECGTTISDEDLDVVKAALLRSRPATTTTTAAAPE